MARRVRKPDNPIVLNPEQRAAVAAGPGYWAVSAGPGSGKTSVIVERYKRLRAIAPAEEILSLTFTQEAAREMAQRAGFERDDSVLRPHGFRTFHSLALSFATIEHKHFPFELQPFPLATEGQSGRFAGDASRKFKLDYKRFRQYLSQEKRAGRRPAESLTAAESEGVGQEFALAYKEYEQRMRDAGVLDFDSLLQEMYALLNAEPAIRERWQYCWIMTDESQDCDIQQWEIVRQLSRRDGNVFSVGDAGQCVYQWRSAHPELFLNFDALFPGAQKLYLAKNHRSTQQIVEFVKKIGPVPDLAERFFTENEAGVPPTITAASGEYEEVTNVLEQLRRPIMFEPSPSVAILARTNRALHPYEEALASAGVRYHLLGKSGFWQQAEIRNALAYVQLASAPFDAAVFGALRAPFHPSRFIRKPELVDALKARHKATGVSAWKALNEFRHPDAQQLRAIGEFVSFAHRLRAYGDSVPAGQLVQQILADLRAVEYYSEEEEAIDNSPVDNLRELTRIAGRFSTAQEFLQYVQRIQAASRVKKGVSLGTCHAAKGREWSTVFLVNVREGALPHVNGDLEEEKRIWFVGCSRAAKRLFISYSGAPSRFLAPFLQDALVDEVSRRAGQTLETLKKYDRLLEQDTVAEGVLTQEQINRALGIVRKTDGIEEMFA